MGNKLKKSLLPSPIYNSNYDLNDNTSNDFQSFENRNAIVSNACSLIDDANGVAAAAAAAAALDTINDDDDDEDDGNNDEKSISIKNRLGDTPSKSWCLNANKRQTNNMNDSSRAYCLNVGGRQRPNQQLKPQHQHQHQQQSYSSSKLTFESARPMKTQCETYCKCCTSSNSDSLIMQHSIATFKLCCTHGKHSNFFSFSLVFDYCCCFVFLFVALLHSFWHTMFLCHFSFAKPSQPA